MVGRRLREILRLAIGVGGRCAAPRPGGEAPVDAVAISIIGDDKHALFGSRRCGKAEPQKSGETDPNHPHSALEVEDAGGSGIDSDNVSKIVKLLLTLRFALGHQIFPVFCTVCGKTLTAWARQIIVPA
jgi:hypothetical protein